MYNPKKVKNYWDFMLVPTLTGRYTLTNSVQSYGHA